MRQRRHPVNPKLLEQIATMTGGTPYLATDTRALAERFQKILEDLEKSRIKDRGIAVRRAVPALPVGRVRAAAARDRAAPHPLPAASLTCGSPIPQLLWLLLVVPAAVLAYAPGVRARGGGCWRGWATRPLIAKMAAAVSVPRKVVRAALVVRRAGAAGASRWRGRRRAGGPS